ncbi:hypothetical protein DRF65_08115 [Chryseobacterium pennae]|uniref:Lipoprotein n=2 Tax=Chryseobacterium pennae TaxID=2258962 RepID=A0A3D9CAN3_9FLAO|nr:hypothetical protein DRF65_08115 [Chryseobacterium pennae]
MKTLISVIILFLMSCQPAAKPSYPDKDMEGKYSRKLSPDHQFTLFYNYEENSFSPVKWLSYYVTETKTSILKKEKTKILADTIYWRPDNVLVIIPYREVIKAQTGEDEKSDDDHILIPIKKTTE